MWSRGGRRACERKCGLGNWSFPKFEPQKQEHSLKEGDWRAEAGECVSRGVPSRQNPESASRGERDAGIKRPAGNGPRP